MSTYDERDTAITRDPLHGQPPYQQVPPQQYYGYPPQGYGRRFGGGMGMSRAGGWSETKPFYMTSEFIGTLVCVIGIAITAAIAADLDSHRASALISGLVAAYTISRGIAKSGTRSRATDPRDDLSIGRSHDSHAQNGA